MDESVVSASLKSLKLNNTSTEPQDEVFIKKLYSKPNLPVE